MTVKQHFLTYLTAALISGTCLCSQPVFAAPSFNIQMVATNLKELVKQEGRNKLMKYGAEYIEVANNFIATVKSLTQPFVVPEVNSVTDPEEWISYVPKQIEPLLKIEKAEDEPDVDKVQEEVTKIVFVNKDNQETYKLSRKQQDLLLFKVATNASGVSGKSLDLSANAATETEKWRERINTEGTDEVALWHFTALLHAVHRRKVRELLYLQSLQLELHAAEGLLNKEKPIDTSNIELMEPPASETSASTPTGSTETSTGSTQTPASPTN